MPEKMTIGTKEITVFDTTEAAEMTGFSWSYIKTRIADGTIPAITIPSRAGIRSAKHWIPDYVLETIPSTCYRRQPGRPRKNHEKGKDIEEYDPKDFAVPEEDHSFGLEIETIASASHEVDPVGGIFQRFKRLLRRA